MLKPKPDTAPPHNVVAVNFKMEREVRDHFNELRKKLNMMQDELFIALVEQEYVKHFK